MKRPLPVVALMLLVASVALSGCVSEDPQVAARGTPVWQPGYTWVYETTSEHSVHSDGDARSGSATRETTHRVVATEPTLDEPVYWLRVTDGDVDAPLLDDSVFGNRGGLVAVSQVDLSPRAYVSEWDLEVCGADLTNVRAWPADDPFRMLAFPLDEGDSWEGGEDEIRYVATVAGTETVSVPAGSFAAVRIDYALTFEEPEREDAEADEYREEVTDFRSTFTVWYSPAVKNVVKIVSSVSAHIKEYEEEFDISMGAEILLKDHSLEPEEPEALPETILVNDITGYDHEMVRVRDFGPYRIVSDQVFPLNAAETNDTVTFGITNAPPGEDSLPGSPLYDEEVYDLHWQITESTGTTEMRSVIGPTLSIDPVPGRYWIEAELVSKQDPVDDECMHRSVRMPVPIWIAPAEAEVFWMKSYDIDVKTGETGSRPLETLPPTDGYAEVRFEISVEDTQTGLSDAPRLVFKGPNGEVERFAHSDSFFASGGQWDVEWHPNGPGSELGQGHALGHSATVQLELRY